MIILITSKLLPQNQNVGAELTGNFQADAIIIRPQNPEKTKTGKNIFQQNLGSGSAVVVQDQQ